MLLILIVLLQMVLFHDGAESASMKETAAKTEKLDSGLVRITLTPQAAERLDIQTAKVREGEVKGSESKQKKIIPYAAVLYNKNGEAWAYISTEPLVFMRHPIIIERIDRDDAILTEGPPVDTKVVITGVAELNGTEEGLGK